MTQEPYGRPDASDRDLIAKLEARLSDGLQRLKGAACQEPFAFIATQNEVMLVQFCLEQWSAKGCVSAKLGTILDRDFGGALPFRSALEAVASIADVRWVTLGLCFSDFRFHLLPISDASPIPFCVTPIAVWYVARPATNAGDSARCGWIDHIWNCTNWDVVQARLDCLESPLDVLSEPESCAHVCCSGDSSSS